MHLRVSAPHTTLIKHKFRRERGSGGALTHTDWVVEVYEFNRLPKHDKIVLHVKRGILEQEIGLCVAQW